MLIIVNIIKILLKLKIYNEKNIFKKNIYKDIFYSDKYYKYNDNFMN